MNKEQPVSSVLKAKLLVSFVSTLEGFNFQDQADGMYSHMGATITDAILQAGINYKHVVEPRVEIIRRTEEARTTSGFIRLLESYDLSSLIRFKGKKVSLIIEVSKFFKEQNIETEEDLKAWLEDYYNIKRLKQIKGIGNKTSDYFKILVGIDTSAIDRHLISFLQRAGLEVDSYENAKEIIDFAADALNVNRALFDLVFGNT